MLTEYQKWRFSVMAGLSLALHLEQNLDDKELALILEGWTVWASGHATQGVNPAEETGKAFADFCRTSLVIGGAGAKATERLIDVYKHLGEIHGRQE